MQKRIEFIFDKIAEKAPSNERDIGVIKKILEDFSLKGKAVLEIGCGFGDSVIYCARKGASYAEGFDISNESIKIAKSKFNESPNVFFHKCGLEEYKTERKFDIIIGWGIFEYLTDPLKSLEKICGLLSINGAMILLISKPIFIKRLSRLPRIFLSKIPLKATLPVAGVISKILTLFNSRLQKILYMKASRTYTIEQAILDGLMVPRYNVFHHKMFTDYLLREGFSVKYLNDVTPSTICIIARKSR